MGYIYLGTSLMMKTSHQMKVRKNFIKLKKAKENRAMPLALLSLTGVKTMMLKRL